MSEDVRLLEYDIFCQKNSKCHMLKIKFKCKFLGNGGLQFPAIYTEYVSDTGLSHGKKEQLTSKNWKSYNNIMT
jgi:hypothetical protein